MRNKNESRPYFGNPDYMDESHETGNRVQRPAPYSNYSSGSRYSQSRGQQPAHERRWDEGNYFHTGPQKHGAQDRYTSGHTFQNHGSQQYGNHPYHPHHAGQEHHYGNDPNSVYRNPNALNYGDDYTAPHQRWAGNAGGSAPGTRDYPSVNEDPHFEGPGSRSRYKESDYRYGSGQHNWYLEGRYSHEQPGDEAYDRHHHPHHPAHRHHEHEGFFDRMGNKISNAWHAITGEEEDEGGRNYERYNDRTHRRHMHHDQERKFNRGYESGPGWADEHTAVDPYKHHSNADAKRSYYGRRRDW